MSDPGLAFRSTAAVERRVDAIQAAFEARGLEPAEAIDQPTHLAEEQWVPQNGARVVAKAWTDPAFRQRLLANGRDAVAELGLAMPKHHRHLVVLENTPTVQNVICCTLCSCTAFTIIGLPPDWYKDLEYRARVVRQSRTVLKEMGLDLPPEVEIRVWDTTADTRYMVLPVQPPHTDGLAGGAARGDRHQGRDDRRRAPLGDRPWTACTTSAASRASAAVRYAPTRRRSTQPWEKRVNALYSLAVRLGIFNMDEYRHAIERMEPRHYLIGELLRALADEPRDAVRREGHRHAGGARAARAGRISRSRCRARRAAPNVAARERFKPGDRVRVRDDYVPGHVRMPGYIRGKTGVVVSESPAYPFPDAHAHGVAGGGRAHLRRALPQPRTSGRTRPTPRSCTSACSRATCSGWSEAAAARRLALARTTDPIRAPDEKEFDGLVLAVRAERLAVGTDHPRVGDVLVPVPRVPLPAAARRRQHGRRRRAAGRADRRCVAERDDRRLHDARARD